MGQAKQEMQEQQERVDAARDRITYPDTIRPKKPSQVLFNSKPLEWHLDGNKIVIDTPLTATNGDVFEFVWL